MNNNSVNLCFWHAVEIWGHFRKCQMMRISEGNDDLDGKGQK